MKNLTFITTCQNGKKVFDRPFTHCHKDVKEDVLVEALSKLTLNDIFHKEVIDMGYIIGKDSCVEITKDDDIVYVIRKGRNGPTPMVKNRVPIDSSFLTILLKRIELGDYVLISSYIGKVSEPEPWDSNFYNQFTWEKKVDLDKEWYQKCIDFWNTHALIYDKANVSLHLST